MATPIELESARQSPNARNVATARAAAIEAHAIAAADANPHLAVSVALASGLWGIENELELPPPVEGNAYAMQHPETAAVPPTLWDAAQRLKASKAARALFGDAFVEHYAASREWEEREQRKHITDWQLQRYFEII